MKAQELMTRFRFPGKVSKMGKNKIIWIPKEYYDNPTLAKLEGKRIIIQLDDEI